MGSKDERHDMSRTVAEIVSMYKDNRNSTPEYLGSMLDDVFFKAGCMPVDYDGGLRWDPGDVSPSCTCLRNLHVEYFKAVRPNNMGLLPTEMGSDESKNKLLNFTLAVENKCFRLVRHTQVIYLDFISNDSEHLPPT